MEPALEALFDDANGDLALGALEDAVSKYKQCTEAAPDYFEAWHALGMVNMKLGRFNEAIEAGLRAVELHPKDQLAWSSLSLFYVRNGQTFPNSRIRLRPPDLGNLALSRGVEPGGQTRVCDW